MSIRQNPLPSDHPNFNTPSKVFVGEIITSCSGSHAITVARSKHGGAKSADGGYMMQGTLATSVMASIFGFRESAPPQPGTQVVCLEESASHCYILGMLPKQNPNLDNMPNRAALGAGNALEDSANRKGHEKYTPRIYDNRRPTDAVDGEHVVSNEFGVLLGLYQQLANLKASELAQVQCFLLDDLVRVISHNFQHYTALGEYNIYHDGKALMAEFGATHKTSEAYGKPAVNSDSSSATFTKTGTHTADDENDFYKISGDERIKAIERFKWFLGTVGDFLHVFMVRPDPQESRVLDPTKKPNKPDTGLCDLHIGTDGGLHLRSVKEVFIEKTNWIRVPLRVAAPDDEAGDDAAKIKYKEKELFKFDNEIIATHNPIRYALQIRDYVAYVNEKLNYENFKKHEKDFYVNDELSKEEALNRIGKVDQETSLKLSDYKLRTAGIYLMPNGGITIRDAWNSAIIMEGGNVYIQPAKDLITQPLRSMVVKAGKNINMSCRKHIDLSSSDEGMRIKTHKSQYLYSHEGGVILEANAEKDVAYAPIPSKGALQQVGGIVLKSSLGIYNYAEKNIVNFAKGKMLLQSLDNMDITAGFEDDKANKTANKPIKPKKNNSKESLATDKKDESSTTNKKAATRKKQASITVYSQNNMTVLADKSMLLHSKELATMVSDKQMILAGAAATLLGEKGDSISTEGVIETEKMVKDIFKKPREIKKELLKQTVFEKATNFEALEFKFLNSKEYGSDIDKEKDPFPITLAQQDNLLTNLYKLEEWKEEKINESYPYPGKDLFEKFYYITQKPNNLQKHPIDKDSHSKADPQNIPATITLTSLSKYKVLK
jgi:hypothetical protein